MPLSKKLTTLCVIFVGFILTACGVGAGTETSNNIEVSQIETPLPSPTQVFTPIPTFTPEPTLSPEQANIGKCKIRPYSFTNVGLGIPVPSQKMSSVGDVTTIVLFADFSDVSASQTPDEVFSIISPDAEKFFSDISYGRMNWMLEPHFVWLRLSQSSSYYGKGVSTYEGHLEFIQEAVNLADPDVDFSGADSVIVLVPPEAYSISYGPAFGGNDGEGYSADGKVFENGVTSGADLPAWGFLWLNHESGHTLGLPDLYAYQYDVSYYEDQHRFVGGFGLMGYIDGKAPEFFAFERWQLGWLDDDQIICLVEPGQSYTLTAIEAEGGVKAVMVPINQHQVLVVESRRPLGYDSLLAKSGALVYIVDTDIASGEGTLVVYPNPPSDPYRDQSPLGIGESVDFNGIEIRVTAADDLTDTIQVTFTK